MQQNTTFLFEAFGAEMDNFLSISADSPVKSTEPLLKRRGMTSVMEIRVNLAQSIVNDEDLTEIHYTSTQLENLFAAATPPRCATEGQA